MPLYEYQCSVCQAEFTEKRTMSDMLVPTQEPCPACGELTVEKVILTAPSLGDSVRLGVRRIDNGFKEVLQKVHETTPGSRISDNSRYL
jgi:putative FmdB family regulatory protein